METMTRRQMTPIETAPTGGILRYEAGGLGLGELLVNRASYGPHGKGARIAFATTDSQFGRLLIAATEVGVCWLGVSNSDAYLESELRTDLAAAELARDDDRIAAIAPRIADYLSGRSRELVLPIDIRATPFQAAVWAELCAIPWGATRSYGEIAQRLGSPGAARAVGHANGANPLAIVIPCHRAIGGGGALTGYRWGLEYKRRLLEHERAFAQGALALS